MAAAPTKKLLRAGFAGAGDGSQHRQARTSLRRRGWARIASLAIRRTLAVARACFQVRRRRMRGSSAASAAMQHAAEAIRRRRVSGRCLRSPRQALLLARMRGLVRSHRAEVHLISRTAAR
jgi:hypothetical protein